MKRRNILIATLSLTALGLPCLPGNAFAQQKTIKEQIIGTWSLTSVYNLMADGTKVYSNGAHARGQAIFELNGQFSIQIINMDIPKFASNNRLRGTPEEYEAVARGVSADFGTYTVNEENQTVTFNFEGSSFPNVVGEATERKVSISNDDLQWVTQGAPSGGAAYRTWKRLK